MNNIRLIVFDWDGTLSDSADRIVSAVLAAAVRLELPLPAPQAIRNIIGLGMLDSYTTLFPDHPTTDFVPFTEAYRDAYLGAEQSRARLFPGALRALGDLAPHYTLAVATGKSRVGLDRELHETATATYFEVTRTADETEPKPSPRMLLEILEHTGFDSSQTLMIGDTDHDIHMARNADVPAVAVNCGAQLADRLHAANPATILESVADLTSWLGARKVSGPDSPGIRKKGS